MLQWSDTYLLSLQVQVSFTDKRAQNKLKHQERAIHSYSLKIIALKCKLDLMIFVMLPINEIM